MTDTYRPPALRELLKRYDIHLSRGLGQNFITDVNIVGKIAGFAGLDGGKTVVEIGPGAGALTAALAAGAGRVVAVEIDRRLAPLLDETLKGMENVELVWGDFLKMWDGGLKAGPGAAPMMPDAVAANLPYSITSPVIFRILEGNAIPATMVFMVQREVADRIASPPGSKAYGVISVFCRYYCDVEMCMYVPKEAFMPRPKVDSAVIRMTPHGRERRRPVDEGLFRSVVKAGFGMRRKTLRNALQPLMGGLGATGTAASEVFGQAGVDPSRRAETLSVDEFIDLADGLSGIRKAVG